MPAAPKVCLDVDYADDAAVAACVGFCDWEDAAATFELCRSFPGAPAVYEPGEFFRRELPYLRATLESLEAPPALVVVDGFVWLDGGRPGLGAHLHEALGGTVAVVGVAKRPFHQAAGAVPILRGASHVPLFVSAVGLDLQEAAAAVQRMHGEHRIPTLLKRVDQLSRAR